MMPDSTTRLRADFAPVAGFTFRDARPFQAGENTAARSLPFPPIPAPFWSAACAAVRPQIGSPKRAYLFGLARSHVDFFPPPLDLRVEDLEGKPDKNRDPSWTRLLPVKDPGIVAMKGLASPVLFAPEASFSSKSLEHRLLTGAQWRAYLTGESLTGTVRSEKEFLKNDVRVGVQLGKRRDPAKEQSRDEPRQATPGRLYSEQIAFLDPKQGGVVFRLGLEFGSPVGATGSRLDTSVRLGGESRLAGVRFEAGWDGGFDENLMKSVKGRVLKQTGPPWRVKLCFLTPTVFSANLRWLQESPGNTPAWRPFWLKPGKLSEPPHSSAYRLKLVAALVDKARPVGFWDSKSEYPKEERQEAKRPGAGAPKPLYRIMPAGAVYFLELHPAGCEPDQALDAFFEDFWLKTILVRKDRELSFFGQMGFGITVIGDWDYARENK